MLPAEPHQHFDVQRIISVNRSKIGGSRIKVCDLESLRLDNFDGSFDGGARLVQAIEAKVNISQIIIDSGDVANLTSFVFQGEGSFQQSNGLRILALSGV